MHKRTCAQTRGHAHTHHITADVGLVEVALVVIPHALHIAAADPLHQDRAGQGRGGGALGKGFVRLKKRCIHTVYYYMIDLR